MKTAPQYLYKPNNDGTFTIQSYVFCNENPMYRGKVCEYINYVSTEKTEIDCINRIIRLNGIA